MLDGAFEDCSSLTSITIPDSVTSIGSSAFENCSSLTSITIPDSITSINSSAFEDCSSLQYNEYDNAYYLGNDNNPYLALIKAKSRSITSCTINEKTKIIGSSAFSGCSGLESIIVAPGNKKYKSVNNCLIETETKTLIKGCKNSVIPNDGSVTSIGSSAFSGCSSLTSIRIPSTVITIGGAAFYGCGNLEDVYITDIEAWCNIEFDDMLLFSNPLYNENSALYLNGEKPSGNVVLSTAVKKIPYGTFKYCKDLTSVTIPDSVTSIGSSAFSGCSWLIGIDFNGTKAQWEAIDKGSYWQGFDSITVYCTDGNIEV